MKFSILNTIKLALICFSIELNAQDPSFSQFEFNRLYFNPAYCGSSSCERAPEITTSYRRQWPLQTTLKTSQFTTSKVDINYPIAYKFSGVGLGLGGIFTSDNEGEAFLQKNTVGFILGANCKFGELINHSPTQKALDSWVLNVGSQLSYIHYSLDWSKLRFSNQYDPVVGFVDANAEPLSSKNSYFLPDIAVGGILTKRLYNKNIEYLQLGCAVHHINSPSVSFYDKGYLPSKLVTHISTHVGQFKPVFAIEYQNKMYTSVVNVNVIFDTGSGDLIVGTGTRYWRNCDAILLCAAYKQSVGLHSFTGYVNVDITVSGLYKSGETWELGVLYNYNKCNKLRAMGCPKSKWKRRCSEDAYYDSKKIKEKKILDNNSKSNIPNN